MRSNTGVRAALKGAGLLVLSAILSFSLVACDGDVAPSPPSPPVETATQPAESSNPLADATKESKGMNTVQVILDEWTILPVGLGVPSGETAFTVVNKGKVEHNLTIMQDENVIAQTPNFKSGEGPQTIEANLQPGTYRMVCTIPGHSEQGMVGTLSVEK